MASPPPTQPVEPVPDVALHPTTLWTQIARAQADGAAAEGAWRTLVQRYQPVIENALRRHFPDQVEDLAQQFLDVKFVRRLVPMADPARGRFRGLLGKVLERFVVDECRRRSAGSRIPEDRTDPLDTRQQEELTAGSGSVEPPGTGLDREYAQVLFGRAFRATREEYLAGGGTAEQFELFLGRRFSRLTAEAAAATGLSEDAVKQRRRRLREKLREAFTREVAATVEPHELKAEIRYLVSLLGIEALSDDGGGG